MSEMTPEAFVDQIRGLWAYPEYVKEKPVVSEIHPDRDEIEVSLVTGGLSDNEIVQERLSRTFFHLMWWYASFRGGLTTYRIPEPVYRKPVPVEWLTLPKEED